MLLRFLVNDPSCFWRFVYYRLSLWFKKRITNLLVKVQDWFIAGFSQILSLDTLLKILGIVNCCKIICNSIKCAVNVGSYWVFYHVTEHLVILLWYFRLFYRRTFKAVKNSFWSRLCRGHVFAAFGCVTV